MSLLPRVLVGQRGNAFGLFISKPGKNVLTADDDDLLISPLATRTNFSFLERGLVQLTRGSVPRTVLFDTVPNAPIPLTQVHRQGVSYVPALQGDMPKDLRTGFPSRYRVTTGRNFVQFVNLKDRIYQVKYLLLAQPGD